MPEMWFRVSWPDGSETENYSPSLVIRDYFKFGESYALDDFLQRIRAALQIASDRVEAKYGFPCSRARATLSAIERQAGEFVVQRDPRITILEVLP
jgi:uncharacterized repeat protein (TIGR04042 family)